MTAIRPEATSAKAAACSKLAWAGFHSVAFGISGSTVSALIFRVVISRLRLGEFGCCSYELRPCTISAAPSSACSKNSLSPLNFRLSGMTRLASASMPSAEMMTYPSKW